MIELSFHTAIMVYLLIALFGILSVWLFGHFTAKREKTISPKEEIKTCEYCMSTYLAYSSSQVSKCPICKSFNEKKTCAK